VVVKSAATMRMSFLSLDAAGRTGDTPLKDVRVRRAIFHAIDREAIAKNLVGEGAAVQKSLCVPVQFGCTTDVPDYPYDPAKAKALLAEAGHPNLSIPFYAYRDRPYSEAVLNYLRQAGTKPELKFLQWQALRPLIIEGKTEVAHLTFGSNGILDASASTSYYFRHSVDDYARDPEVRDWLAEADTSTDPENRKALYAKALKKINDQAYAVPLFIYGRTYAYSQDFEFPLTQDEMAHFYMARWK
jgi:peptide/nickel transport system substrate-binding protein